MPIKFGTAGWRGLIARDFTFDRVRLATQAIAQYLRSEVRRRRSPVHGFKPLVILGHDTRFLGREFALAAAEVLGSNGLTPLLCNRATPTPVIAHSIRSRKAIGGINLTASHYPAQYQGLKFSTSDGGPANPEVTRKLEQLSARLLEKKWSTEAAVVGTYQCRQFDPRPAYLRQIHKLIDFKAIRAARLRVAVEMMYGAGHGYLDTLLEGAGAEVACFHNEINPLFGGHPPEPSAQGMGETIEFVRSGRAQLGLGLAGDAGQFGIVDRDGTWLRPNQVLALVVYHLKQNRHWTGAAVCTVPANHPVGGEESGGLTVKEHVPEKDGILVCLLIAELVARERQSLRKILDRIEKKAE